MKRLLTIILVLIISISSIVMTGCQPTDEELIEDELDARYTEILGVLEAAENVNDVRDYLLKWANSLDIGVSYDDYGNVIMSSKATEGYENAETNIFQCTVDLDNPESSAASMAVTSYIIEGANEHGFIRALFTSPDGIPRLLRTYVVADNFINLDWNENNSLLVGSAGSDYYTMSCDLDWERSSYTNAYQIKVSGLPSHKFTEQSHPNPITIIGDILAKAKSASILLEIAEFNGGTSADTYAADVTCTIMMNQKDVNSMKKRVQNAKDKIVDKYDIPADSFEFTFEEVEAPDKVIAYDDAAELISFLYTCIDGTYLKDDAGEIIAKANIGVISTESGDFKAELYASSKSEDILSEMEATVETTCLLSNVNYYKKAGNPIWENSSLEDAAIYNEEDILDKINEAEHNTLVNNLSIASDEVIGKTPSTVRTLGETVCADVAKRISNMNIVGFGISESTMLKDTEILLTYLRNGK